MTVRVLGPLDAGAALSPRERSILSALIVRQGAAVAPAELADACWGAQTPATWPQQVKKSVSAIRRSLGSDSVHTHGAAYALGLDIDTIDAVRFERLVSAARHHALHGDVDRAADTYGRALALWRGTPYPDISSWEPGAVEAMRLLEIRDSAEEELVEAQLRGGHHRTVIPEAERLVRENPLRESRWELLALANYRSGRQADALATVRSARERLLEELGIEPGEALRDLEVAILRQDRSLLPDETPIAVSSDCPYLGLASFGPGDAALFFGREPDIDAIVERVRAASVVAVVGPSGSGKSSLVLAGVVPRLQAAGRSVRILRPGYAGATTLQEATDRGVVVLVVDQAEELLDATPEQIADFCRAAAGFLEAGGAIVVTVRSDFLDRMTGLPEVGAAIGRSVYALAPLGADALRLAIEAPARHARLRLEPGLVELVLRDAADRGTTLPHVSHALHETWARREGSLLTVDGYEATGGIAGAIAQSADTLYGGLDVSDQALCRAMMLRLITRDADGVSLRRRVPTVSLLDDPARRRVIERLVAARLVVMDDDAIVIAHEAIATAWPRLDGWLEADAEGARLMGTLQLAAETWDADGRPDDALLRGARLRAAVEWQHAASPDLTAVESAFLAASSAREQDEFRELEARAAEHRSQNRRLRWALAGAAALLVAALVAGGVAAGTAQDASIEAFTSSALSLRSTDRELAALMAVAAYERWPSDERTRAALIGSVTESGPYVGTTYIPDAQWRVGMWPIPGTTHVAVVRDQVNVEIDDYITGERVRTLSTTLERPPGIIRPWVRVSADGSTIAVSQHFPNQDATDTAEHVSFFDIATGAQVGSTVVAPSGTDTISLSPDGAHLTWATTGQLVVIDRDTGAVRTTSVETEPPASMSWSAASAYAPDGSLLVATVTGRLMTLDPDTFEVRRSVTIPPERANNAISVAQDGSVFGIGLHGMVSIAPDGTTLWTRGFERPVECSRAVASSASLVAACGDERGTVQIWDLRSGARLDEPFEYQAAGQGDLAFVDDGREMLLLSAILPRIGRLRVDGTGAASRLVARGQTSLAGFDSAGEHIIVEDRELVASGGGGAASSFAVWDIAADTARFRVPDDVSDDYDGFLVDDPRWVTDELVATWAVERSEGESGEVVETTRPIIIDVSTGRIVPTELPDDTWDLFRNADGTRIYVTTARSTPSGPEFTGRVQILDAQTLRLLPVEFRMDGFLNSITESDGGEEVFVTTFVEDGQAGFRTAVFDGQTGEPLAEGLPRMFGVTWSGPDRLVTIADTGLFEYSATTLTRTGTLPALKSRVSKLALTEDRRTLLTAGTGDEGVSLVDLTTRRRLGDAVFSDGFGQADITRDGSAFIVPLPQGVALWTLDPAEQSRALCRVAGREPTSDEWRNYFSGLGAQVPLCADALG